MDMGSIMKQAQQFQEKLSEIQDELGNKRVTGSAGGGMVTATVNGKGDLIGISLEKGIVDPKEIGMLQDLIVSAINDAHKKAKELERAELGKLTGGLRIPGLF